eukprot:CAMPEP_0175895366 /NCGR_PEP_ID=MMETSP0107_2-20121207/50476_1 /TAXON_ID=195067 ORGANISM="Goniomonas pacifica, Strain CCMP1869" /NCGR_SAMPLE_ID=MMETSP0107_2 /ASSEMBLY_ACC=CAM_ASM_000203 /LENGTH=215 /DNA_ID=CAMNT_0017216499 /DNA_START=748 /DNA_END=1396 /DNA_ORIENTATION=-
MRFVCFPSSPTRRRTRPASPTLGAAAMLQGGGLHREASDKDDKRLVSAAADVMVAATRGSDANLSAAVYALLRTSAVHPSRRLKSQDGGGNQRGLLADRNAYKIAAYMDLARALVRSWLWSHWGTPVRTFEMSEQLILNATARVTRALAEARHQTMSRHFESLTRFREEQNCLRFPHPPGPALTLALHHLRPLPTPAGHHHSTTLDPTKSTLILF